MDVDDSVALVTRPTDSTQFYLFNLFADYIVPHGGRIWTNDLLYLLRLLGIGERAARTTLSRMRQRGWFVTHRDGRQSRYEVTEQGRSILAEGDERIFEEPFTDWDGRWHLVVYSLPEEKRRLRNQYRKKLIWFGFGNLAPGTWVSPHDRQVELGRLAAKLAVEAYVTHFTADTPSDDAIVRQCWDIPALEAGYHAFLVRYQEDYEAFRRSLEAGGEELPSPEQCFVRRFWLTYTFQRFPLKDPNLPVELLPEKWVGFRARQLFSEYRALLAEGMDGFIGRMLGGAGEGGSGG